MAGRSMKNLTDTMYDFAEKTLKNGTPNPQAMAIAPHIIEKIEKNIGQKEAAEIGANTDIPENEEYTFEQAKEYAKKIIEDMAAAELTYSDAARVLRIASNEIGNRMRSEKVKASQ